MIDLQPIEANAALVVKMFDKPENGGFGYDERSVEWLDGYIERNRLNWDAATAEKLTSVLGSYLGECLRRNYGGEWTTTEYGLGVEIGGSVAFPFSKVGKQIENGADDSIASFYTTVPLIFGLNFE